MVTLSPFTDIVCYRTWLTSNATMRKEGTSTVPMENTMFQLADRRPNGIHLVFKCPNVPEKTLWIKEIR